MSKIATPELSVVVVILTREAKCLMRCLSSLMCQESQSPEIIVPCDDTSSHLLQLQEKFATVRFLPVTGVRTYAELRTIGVHESKGSIIALTEDHCTPASDWCEQIILAHKNAAAAVGGAVDKKAKDSALNWAFYLADYARYMNPVLEGPTNQLSDCNVSYKRRALEQISEIWRKEFHEPSVHAALINNNQSLLLSPRIVVYQQRSLTFTEAMRDRYAFGRLFSATRCEGFPPGRRLFYATLSTLLPLLLVTRVAGQVLRAKRCRNQFFRALPYLVIISSVWTAGECLGYVTARAARSLTPETATSESQPTTSQEALV